MTTHSCIHCHFLISEKKRPITKEVRKIIKKNGMQKNESFMVGCYYNQLGFFSVRYNSTEVEDLYKIRSCMFFQQFQPSIPISGVIIQKDELLKVDQILKENKSSKMMFSVAAIGLVLTGLGTVADIILRVFFKK